MRCATAHGFARAVEFSLSGPYTISECHSRNDPVQHQWRVLCLNAESSGERNVHCYANLARSTATQSLLSWGPMTYDTISEAGFFQAFVQLQTESSFSQIFPRGE